MLSLLLAAAEPSKTPVLIAGVVFAAYAVLLAAVGLTRPTFPYGNRGARGVMLVSLVLAVATIGLAVATSK